MKTELQRYSVVGAALYIALLALVCPCDPILACHKEHVAFVTGAAGLVVLWYGGRMEPSSETESDTLSDDEDTLDLDEDESWTDDSDSEDAVLDGLVSKLEAQYSEELQQQHNKQADAVLSNPQ